MKFHYREALTPVLLVKFPQSRLQRDVRIWVNIMFALTFLKTDNCESRNNHRYAVVAGVSHPMARQLKEACKSSWNPRGNRKSFTLTIPWNSAKLVKISPGIIARLHHTDRTQMVLHKEQSAE